jgi:uncharacterized membrane protein
MNAVLSRRVMRWLMIIFYFAAGLFHLRNPEAFLPIVPGWVPLPRATVLITGVCELAGAAGLMIPRLRHAAGIGLALYALCVWPANIKHALDGVVLGGVKLGWSYHAPRLAFQPVLIWWALYVGEVTRWPFAKAFGRLAPHR